MSCARAGGTCARVDLVCVCACACACVRVRVRVCARAHVCHDSARHARVHAYLARSFGPITRRVAYTAHGPRRPPRVVAGAGAGALVSVVAGADAGASQRERL